MLREEIAFIVEHESHPKDGFGFKRNKSVVEEITNIDNENPEDNNNLNNEQNVNLIKGNSSIKGITVVDFNDKTKCISLNQPLLLKFDLPHLNKN